MDPKILIIDIETTPNLGWFWDLKPQYISVDRVVERQRVLCFAAKWYGSKQVMFHAEWQKGHLAMVTKAHELLSEADAVLGFNSNSFDLKKLNAEFWRYRMGPPAPYQKLDLYRESRKHVSFVSHKLDSILFELSLDQKVKHRGFELWPLCMSGNRKAQAEMKRYNIGDITPLEEAYEIVRPWITTGALNLNLYNGSGCPACGSSNVQKRGPYRTGTGVYQRYFCSDCGRWSRGAKREFGTDLR